jgi:hypothetical protein
MDETIPEGGKCCILLRKKNCTFATNVPALISILFLWLAERKSLEGYMQVEDAQGRLQFRSDGDLKGVHRS